MRTRLLIIGVAIVVLAGVYLAGRLPERAQRLDAEQRAVDVQARLDEADARLRANRVLGDFLMVEDAVAQRNFGQAQELASGLFDRVAGEQSRPHAAGVTSALAEIQSQRDGIIASMARTDAAVADTLRTLQLRLRAGLGYPVP